jgi:hypothetical protein
MHLLTGAIYVVIGIGLIAVSRSDPRWRTMFILLGVSMVMRASADVASVLGWLSEPAWLLKAIEYASMAVTAAALILWWRKLLTTPRATTAPDREHGEVSVPVATAHAQPLDAASARLGAGR